MPRALRSLLVVASLAAGARAFGRNPERSGSFPNPTCLQPVEGPEIPGLGWIAIVRSRAHFRHPDRRICRRCWPSEGSGLKNRWQFQSPEIVQELPRRRSANQTDRSPKRQEK